MVTATTAALNHEASHNSPVGCMPAITVAASPTVPIRTPPTPGTAANVVLRSMA